MARSVRQGCPASGFLFAMVLDPIFRWLQDATIPRNPAGLDFLQPVPCSYADDLAVTAPPSRRLMTALAPAFQVVDQIGGLNLNHRKCCWAQYGSESCQAFWTGWRRTVRNLVGVLDHRCLFFHFSADTQADYIQRRPLCGVLRVAQTQQETSCFLETRTIGCANGGGCRHSSQLRQVHRARLHAD